jgi:8-oxo-dGTP pyrophosphatase MutT (NUDIX family)
MHDGKLKAEIGPGIAAATLILFAEGDGRPAEHLMIQRTEQMRFAPNALVFPGGRVDEDDHHIAGDPARVDLGLADQVDRAHRIAAIREMLEEVGILVGVATSRAVDAAALQAGLKQKAPFSSLLADAGARLDLSALVPWAQWHPRFESHRRFDTRFYIARHDGDRSVSVDVDEVGHARWLHAEQAIAESEAGTAKVIFPTLCNLERLAAYPAFDEAAAHALTITRGPISPFMEVDAEGEQWVCIPDDGGYPRTRRAISTLQMP